MLQAADVDVELVQTVVGLFCLTLGAALIKLSVQCIRERLALRRAGGR
jgi:hypothetical protein